MSGGRTPQHGDGTACLVVDRSNGGQLCYCYDGTNDGHPVERARVAGAADAVAWGRLRSPSVRIRTGDSRTYWAGTAPRPGGFDHTWTDQHPDRRSGSDLEAGLGPVGPTGGT